MTDLNDPRSSIVKPGKAIDGASTLNLGKLKMKNFRDNTTEDIAKLNLGTIKKIGGR